MKYFIYLLLFCTFSLRAQEELFKKKSSLRIGLITSMPNERGKLLEMMQSPIAQEMGKRTYYQGKLEKIETILVAAKVGKVAAALTTAHLILNYDVDLIIFIGVAGAIDPSLKIGDIVIADSLIQHDMDAYPFCQKYELPLLKIKECTPDPQLTYLAEQASLQFVNQDLIPLPILNEFSISHPLVKTGLVITGDQVISKDLQKATLREQLPSALCVEMEGASVAQVCYEYGIPYAVVRIISDYANHFHTQIDVKKFVTQASGYYSTGIIQNLYALILSKIEELK